MANCQFILTATNYKFEDMTETLNNDGCCLVTIKKQTSPISVFYGCFLYFSI
jgi:hypothetical protein